MAKDKPQPQDGPELAEYITTAEPKAYADGVPVFCAHDAIVPIKDLQPNPKNPNQHPPEQIKLLASVIRATGWRGPITVSTRSGYIVKGHGRLMAAELDDLKEAPVDYQNYASEAEEKAERRAIEAMTELMDDPDERLTIQLKYLDRAEWPDVTFALYGNSTATLYDNSTATLYDNSVGIIPDSMLAGKRNNYTARDNATIKDCKHKVICQAGGWKFEVVTHEQD